MSNKHKNNNYRIQKPEHSINAIKNISYPEKVNKQEEAKQDNLAEYGIKQTDAEELKNSANTVMTEELRKAEQIMSEVKTDEVKADEVKADEVKADEVKTTEKKTTKQHILLSSEPEEEKPELVIELSRIYEYDGIEVDKIDISGIEDLNLPQQEKVDKIYRKITKNISSTPEFTPDYAVAMAHVLTGIPLEVIKQLSFKDKVRIKNAIMTFLYGED